jgi:hypothetical protein
VPVVLMRYLRHHQIHHYLQTQLPQDEYRL